MLGIRAMISGLREISNLQLLVTTLAIVTFGGYAAFQVAPKFGVYVPDEMQTADQEEKVIADFRQMDARSTFTPVHGKGLFTFHNVCIEDMSATANLSQTYKKIIVYDSPSNTITERFKVGAHSNVSPSARFWNLTFTTEMLDVLRKKKIYNTAFFLITTCPGNLHHFWVDEFLNLIGTVQRSRSFESRDPNHVVYKRPWKAPQGQPCHNVKRYGEILQTANVADDHDWFGDIASGTCYKNAVFGRGGSDGSKRFVVNHVMTKLGLSRGECPRFTVTLINRNQRRILNMDKLENALQNAGYNNTKVVDLGGLPIREQVEVAMCSSVFIGVSGAGLQWAMFMKPGSVVLEIAWPKKYWGYFYKGSNALNGYDIKHLTLETSDVHLNWTSYEAQVRGGVKVSDEERRRLSVKGPLRLPGDNHWKWADVNVDPATLLKPLKSK